jgi:DNA invertase Pin-like site-specific DNA recombinase
MQMKDEKPKYVAYLRVSTDRQGKSGLGLEAQRTAVHQFVAHRRGEIIAPEYREIESGKVNNRPELEKAMKRCRLTGATLLVAKLDRLSRNAAFLMTLKDSGVPFVAADMPDANTLTIGVMASLAQHEREMISKRTKAALEAARAKGTKLGGIRAGAADISLHHIAGNAARSAKARAKAELLREEIEPLRQAGMSLNAIAAKLNADGSLTPRGKAGRWTPTTVSRIIARY